MTPAIEGSKSNIAAPYGGWVAHNLYIATVAMHEDNVFHQVLIYVNEHGKPYAITPSYEREVTPLSSYYIVRDITLRGELRDIPAFSFGSPPLQPHAYYAAKITPPKGKGGASLGIVFTGFLNGKNGQPGGYGIAIIPSQNMTSYPYRDCQVSLLYAISDEKALKQPR